ncbi:hypothetical protein MS6198_B102 (plasmid) [Escherichia coli]|nr:hypothetical protein MS6198_B102 [Escherichia coli]
MVINPSTHYPDNRVQGLPSVGIEVLPQEGSQAFQLGRKAVLPAGKLQPPVPFARSTPVAGKPQKVERRETFSSLICPRRRHVTRCKELRFVFVKFEAKPAQPFRQHAVEAFRLVLVLEGKYHIVCVSDHVCLPSDVRTADFSKPFVYHMVKVDICKYRGQYGALRTADIITV